VPGGSHPETARQLRVRVPYEQRRPRDEQPAFCCGENRSISQQGRIAEPRCSKAASLQPETCLAACRSM